MAERTARRQGPASRRSDDGPQRPSRRRARLASADVIFEAAATLFLRNGYLGTSMDEVAALAGVSKQTIYTHFANKEHLFTELVVAGVTDRADRLTGQLPPVPEDIGDLKPYLRELAWPFLTTAVDPKVLQLRRLVIGEVNRFPDLARRYYESSHVRATAVLAARLEELSRRGLLPCPDPLLAAHHLAGLVMWMPRNLLTFCPDASFTTRELEQLLESAVHAFLAGYGTTPSSGTPEPGPGTTTPPAT